MSVRDALLLLVALLLTYSNEGLAARNCARPRWERFVDQSSVGATRYHGPDSIRKCLDYCLNTSACVAVDVEVNVYPPGCWPHLNSSRLSESNTYYLAGTNQYRLTSCSSDVTEICTEAEWERYVGYTAVGAREVSGPRTIRQCLAQCEQNVNCVGVDIDDNAVPLHCWMQLSRANLRPDNVFQQQNTSHYRLIRRCPNANRTASGCYNPEWEVFENQNSVGASQYAAAQSVQECLDHCGSQSNCVGVDVDLTKQPPTCWPHLSADAWLTRNVYSQRGTNQYRLKHKCVNDTTGAGCRESVWEVRRGETALGGEQFVGPRTIQQCLDHCNASASCVAVDIDVNLVPLRCWVHVDIDDMIEDNIYTQPGTNSYKITSRCYNARNDGAVKCYNPEWEVYENQNSVGASQYAAAQSVQECLDHCGSQSNCVGVDVDLTKQPPTCWPHFSTDAFRESNVYEQQGTNQYQLKKRCAEGPITETTVPPTVASPTTTLGPNCRQSAWKLRRGETALDGELYVGPRTIQQCLDHCNATASCVAVDIDVNLVPLRCWVHVDIDDIRDDNIYTQPGTDSYQLIDRCPNARTPSECYSPEWEVFENQNSVGASQYEAAQSVQECLDHCGSQSNCVGVDVDLTKQPPTCWPHLSADDFQDKNVYSQRGTNQYRYKTRCAGGSITVPTTTQSTTTTMGPNCRQSSWDHRRDQTALNGALYVGPRTIQQCLDHCNATASCVAVDIDVNLVPLRCWIHDDLTDVRDDNIYTQPGTDFFQLIARCPNARQEPEPVYNPEWEVLVDQNSVGASQYEAAQSVQECLDHCGSQSNCVGVDVDLIKQPPTCWPHFSADDFDDENVYSAPGTNQYRLKSRHASGPITESTTVSVTARGVVECNEHKWEKHENRLSAGAMQYKDAQSVDDCLDFCVVNLDCVAVDINVIHDPPSCWPHFSADQLRDDNVFNQTGVNQYRLIQRCATGQDYGVDRSVVIGLAVGLGVPLFILLLVVCLMLCCCVLGGGRDRKPVEAINTFFPFPSLARRHSTIKSTTSSDSSQKDLEPVYESPTIEVQHYENHTVDRRPHQKEIV